ncbi:MAG: response regulator [Limisphaerales bacterium]
MLSSIHGKTFLVIEDNAENAVLIRRAFGALKTCAAFVCRNNSEAKAYVLGAGMYSRRDEFPFPNAVICDLRFGDESGSDFLKWIKSLDQDWKDLPVYILANRHAPDELKSAKERGAAEILKKPESQEELQNMFADLAGKLCV